VHVDGRILIVAAVRRRAALYHRVSTREQNPRLARVELRAAAAARGLRVVLDVEETASGRGSVRPGLDRVLDAVSASSADRASAIVQRRRYDFGAVGRSGMAILRTDPSHGARPVVYTLFADGLLSSGPAPRSPVGHASIVVKVVKAKRSDRQAVDELRDTGPPLRRVRCHRGELDTDGDRRGHRRERRGRLHD
jgi:hypothetical protein